LAFSIPFFPPRDAYNPRVRHPTFSLRRLILVLMLFTALIAWVMSYKEMGQFTLRTPQGNAALLSRDGRLYWLSWEQSGRLPWRPQEKSLLPDPTLLPSHLRFLGFSYFRGLYQNNPSYARTTVICLPYWLAALLCVALALIPSRPRTPHPADSTLAAD
jgi:hypothetical protein